VQVAQTAANAEIIGIAWVLEGTGLELFVAAPRGGSLPIGVE